jgi:hypothetical protein
MEIDETEIGNGDIDQVENSSPYVGLEGVQASLNRITCGRAISFTCPNSSPSKGNGIPVAVAKTKPLIMRRTFAMVGSDEKRRFRYLYSRTWRVHHIHTSCSSVSLKFSRLSVE